MWHIFLLSHYLTYHVGTVDLAHEHESPSISPLAQQSHLTARLPSSPLSPPLIQISTCTTSPPPSPIPRIQPSPKPSPFNRYKFPRLGRHMSPPPSPIPRIQPSPKPSPFNRYKFPRLGRHMSPPPSPIPRIQPSPKPSPLNRYKFPRMGRRMSLGVPTLSTQHKLPPSVRMGRRMSLRPPSPLSPHKFSPDLRFSGHMPSRLSRRYAKVPPRLRRYSIYSIGSISSLLPENRIGVEEEGEDDGVSTNLFPYK